MYCAEEKTNELQVHPYRTVSWSPTHQGIPLAMVKLILIKSPDEWAIYIFIG